MGVYKDGQGEDPLKEPKDDSKEGYTCHRLEPPPKSSFNCLTANPELYNVVRAACAQQNIKWPVECQVRCFVNKCLT